MTGLEFPGGMKGLTRPPIQNDNSRVGVIKYIVWNLFNSVVPEKIHTHPVEGHWKSLGGGGLKS